MSYVLGFIVLLGVLIFIHELGHFWMAKACGMRVDTFSIGMGKKFLKWTRGETEYALSLLPLGGYVKILGQDPREEIPVGQEHRAFKNKPLWQRTTVVLGGPIFNAVLAVMLFIVLYGVGAPAPAPVLARVLPDSLAYTAGFRSGDNVLQVTDAAGTSHRIREYGDLETLVANSVGQPLNFEVERSKIDGSYDKIKVAYTPVMGLSRDSTLGVMRERGVIEGVETKAAGPVLSVREESWAATRRLPSAFWVDQIEAQAGDVSETFQITRFQDLQERWEQIASRAQGVSEGQIIFKGHRAFVAGMADAPKEPSEVQGPESYTLAWTRAEDAPPAKLLDAGIGSSELVLIEVKPDSPAARLGLQPGDELTHLNGRTVRSFDSFRSEIQILAAAGQEIRIRWLRMGKTEEAAVTPERVHTEDPLTEAKKEQFQIGAAFLALPAAPAMTELKAEGFGDAIALGWTKTVTLTGSMLRSFYYLATGEISHKTLGGPILIGKIAGESVQQGWQAFIRMMAFISLNLFILNLLPVPVLDGGHLVLFMIEAVRRKPLSLKIVEAWTTAGFFLLMGLVAVVFFNDLSRLGLFRIFSS
jgi:regulator of sigma E protease